MRKKLWQYKGKLATCAGLLLVIVIFLPRPTPQVTITHICTTNNPFGRDPFAKSGVFQIVNHLDEEISVGSGFYRPAKRKGFDLQKDDFAFGIGGPMDIEAHSTNEIHVPSPFHGGPYVFVLEFTPASNNTSKFYGSYRWKISNFIIRWVKPSEVTKARLRGVFFAESEPFKISFNP